MVLKTAVAAEHNSVLAQYEQFVLFCNNDGTLWVIDLDNKSAEKIEPEVDDDEADEG